MANKKLVASLVAAVAGFLIGLVGSASLEAVSSATASSGPVAAKTSTKCKRRYVEEHGKCVLSKKKPEAEKKKEREEQAKETAEREQRKKEEAEARRKRAQEEEAKKRQEAEEAEVIAGKALFEATCAVCHGMEGEGVAGVAPAYGPELPRSESIKGVVEQLENPINEKGCKCMGDFSTKYTTAEKEELGAYIAVDLTKKVKIGEE